MTTIYNLRASNNATFYLTRDLSQWAALYDLASATIRMQARASPFAPDPPVYQWATGADSGGLIMFDASTGFCSFSAPLADMGNLPSPLFYDCRLELSDGSAAVLFAGRIVFTAGPTRTASDGSASGVSIGDTVTVDGEASSAPPVLPISLSGAVAGAQAARNAAVAAASAAAASAASVAAASQPTTDFATAFAAWFAGLPTSLPATTGQFWNNGGTLAQS